MCFIETHAIFKDLTFFKCGSYYCLACINACGSKRTIFCNDCKISRLSSEQYNWNQCATEGQTCKIKEKEFCVVRYAPDRGYPVYKYVQGSLDLKCVGSTFGIIYEVKTSTCSYVKVLKIT